MCLFATYGHWLLIVTNFNVAAQSKRWFLNLQPQVCYGYGNKDRKLGNVHTVLACCPI